MNTTGDRVKEYYLPQEKTPYMMTGLVSIDNLTGGFAQGEFVTIAARPGKGKTALSTTMAYNQARRNVNVLYLSLEITDLLKLGMRLLARMTGINTQRMRLPKWHPNCLTEKDWQGLADASAKLAALPITWDTGGSKTIDEIERKIEMAVLQGTQIAYVDQLSKIKAPGNAFQRAAECTNRLSMLASNVGIPIVLMAQLNREFDKTATEHPEVHHCNLEEDSSICLLLNRPSVQEVEAVADEYRRKQLEKTVWLSLAKNRDGRVAQIDTLKFDPKRVCFYDGDMTEPDEDACHIGPDSQQPEEVSPSSVVMTAAEMFSLNNPARDFKAAAAGEQEGDDDAAGR